MFGRFWDFVFRGKVNPLSVLASSHCFALLISLLFVDWRIQVQAQRLVVDWNTCVSSIHAYGNDIDLD